MTNDQNLKRNLKNDTRAIKFYSARFHSSKLFVGISTVLMLENVTRHNTFSQSSTKTFCTDDFVFIEKSELIKKFN